MTPYHLQTLLSELPILFYGVEKIIFPIDDFYFLFHKKKIIIPCSYHAPFVPPNLLYTH